MKTIQNQGKCNGRAKDGQCELWVSGSVTTGGQHPVVRLACPMHKYFGATAGTIRARVAAWQNPGCPCLRAMADRRWTSQCTAGHTDTLAVLPVALYLACPMYAAFAAPVGAMRACVAAQSAAV